MNSEEVEHLMPKEENSPPLALNVWNKLYLREIRISAQQYFLFSLPIKSKQGSSHVCENFLVLSYINRTGQLDSAATFIILQITPQLNDMMCAVRSHFPTSHSHVQGMPQTSLQKPSD